MILSRVNPCYTMHFMFLHNRVWHVCKSNEHNVSNIIAEKSIHTKVAKGKHNMHTLTEDFKQIHLSLNNKIYKH